MSKPPSITLPCYRSVIQLVDSLHLLDLVKDTNTENLALDWDRYADTETSERALDKKLKVSVSGAPVARKELVMMHLHTHASASTRHP